MSPKRQFVCTSVVFSILASASITLSAQQQPADQPNSSQAVPTIRTTVRMVELDVVVNDLQGHTVKGLKASDFTLTENGEPQRLTSVVEHDEALPAAPVTTVPLPANTFVVQPSIAEDVTKTVIVLNGSFTPFMHDQLKAFLKTTRSNPICIYRLDWQGLHLVQSMTTDQQKLLEAVDSRRIQPPLGFQIQYLYRAIDPVKQLVNEVSLIPGHINLVWFGPGTKTYSLDGTYGMSPYTSIGWLSSFGLFTPGLLAPTYTVSYITPDITALDQYLDSAHNALRLGRVVLYLIDADGLKPLFTERPNSVWGGMPIVLQPQNSWRRGQGFSGTSYAGMHIFPDFPDTTQMANNIDACQTLKEMAAKSGGKAFCNTNGLKEALADSIDTGTHYYTVSYIPTNANWNGDYRNIKVHTDSEVRETLGNKIATWFYDERYKGPQVLYRQGYFARSAPDKAENSSVSERKHSTIAGLQDDRSVESDYASKTPIDAGSAFAAPALADLHFKLSVKPSPKTELVQSGSAMPKDNFLVAQWQNKPFRNYHLHYIVRTENLKFASTDDTYNDSLQFVAVLYRDDGSVVNSISNTIPLKVDKEIFHEVQEYGIGYDQTIAVPDKGKYYLRVKVKELPTEHVGVIEVPTEWINIPPEQANASEKAANPLLLKVLPRQ